MFELILCVFCSYQNAQVAKRKGQNTIVWGLITLAAYFIFYCIGAAILLAIMYKGPLDQVALMDFMMSRPIMVITFIFFGLGGYLLVRYLLERMPDVKE